MKATIPYVKEKFREYNQLMFGGTLPELPIELSDAKGFVGVCRYNKRKDDDGNVEYYNFRLSINTRIDLPEAEIEDTIIHEMIHYFIGVNRLEDSSSHGPMFQHLMKSINEKYNRHITISRKVTQEEQEQTFDKRARWHVVAVVRFYGGRIGIKVLPRIVQRILSYNKGISEAQGVERIDFFISNDPFFNRFPNSAALSIYNVPKEELDAHLANARKLSLTEKNVYLP